jgi:hypothetical protein
MSDALTEHVFLLQGHVRTAGGIHHLSSFFLLNFTRSLAHSARMEGHPQFTPGRYCRPCIELNLKYRLHHFQRSLLERWCQANKSFCGSA